MPFYNVHKTPQADPILNKWIQDTSLHSSSLKCVWILFCHLCLYLTNGLSPTSFLIKISIRVSFLCHVQHKSTLNINCIFKCWVNRNVCYTCWKIIVPMWVFFHAMYSENIIIFTMIMWRHNIFRQVIADTCRFSMQLQLSWLWH